MDATQFNTLLQALTQGLQGLVPPQVQQPAVAPATPKISVKIPTYRAAPEENVMTWMLQLYMFPKLKIGTPKPETRN